MGQPCATMALRPDRADSREATAPLAGVPRRTRNASKHRVRNWNPEAPSYVIFA
jgi:hypothetical protein